MKQLNECIDRWVMQATAPVFQAAGIINSSRTSRSYCTCFWEFLLDETNDVKFGHIKTDERDVGIDNQGKAKRGDLHVYVIWRLVHGYNSKAQHKSGVYTNGNELGLVVVIWNVACSESVVTTPNDNQEIVDSRNEEAKTELAVEGKWNGRMSAVTWERLAVVHEWAVGVLVYPSWECLR